MGLIAWAWSRLAILHWKSNLASFTAQSVIFGFDVVHIRLRKPTLQNKLLVQLIEFRLIHLKCSSCLFSINARVVVIAIAELTTPHFLRRVIRKFLTFSSSEPSISGQLRWIFRSSWLYYFMALWSSGLGNYFVCKRFAVQTHLWSLKIVIHINLEHSHIYFSSFSLYCRQILDGDGILWIFLLQTLVRESKYIFQ